MEIHVASQLPSPKLIHLLKHLQVLASGLVGLGTEVARGGVAAIEELGEERLEEGAVDDLSTTTSTLARVESMGSTTCIPSLGKCHPQHKDELEDVVEWEPVDSVDS